VSAVYGRNGTKLQIHKLIDAHMSQSISLLSQSQCCSSLLRCYSDLQFRQKPNGDPHQVD
jgi:hypothetical protein